MDNSYECPKCHNRLPISNKTLHDLRCTERHPMQNDSYQNSYQNNNYRNNNNNRNRNNVPFNNQQNIHTFNNSNNNMNNSNDNNNSFSFGNNFNNSNNNNNYNDNNIVSTNENSYSNPDGTTERIKIDTYQNGVQRVTRTKYDRNNNIILTQTYNQSNNNNSNNNFNNFNNNNFNDSNNFNNNNVSVHTETDNYGNIIETRIERLSNGANKVTKIIKDRNGNIIGQSVSLNNNNNPNNFNIMNNMNMNNMNMDMFGMNMMNNMFGMMGMNNIGQMMNNMNDMNNNANNGVDPNILNNLEVTKIEDVSKLNEDNKKCIICLEEFKQGDEGIYLPCFHLFHKDCIREWLNAHDECPICKFKLTFENINGE